MSRLLPLCFLSLTLGCGGNNDVPSPFGAKPAGPTAQKEGVEWTHAELHAHLNEKGVSASTHPSGERHGGICVAFVATYNEKPQVVDVILLPPGKHAEQKAKDLAGQAGDGAFAWGRFAFLPARHAYGVGDNGILISPRPDDLLMSARAALP